MKKRKTVSKTATESENKKGGPYRDIAVSKKHQVTGFPDIIVEPITSKIDFLIVACDGIWDCYSNEEAIKYVRRKKNDGPRESKSKGLSPTKQRSAKAGLAGYKSGSPLKLGRKGASEGLSPSKIKKEKGATSFIIEDMMQKGLAKGDITMSDGTGTDNMTCIITYFRDPEEVAKEKSKQEESKT